MPQSISGRAEPSEEEMDHVQALHTMLAHGIVVVDPKRNVIGFNSTAEVLTGMSASSVLNQPIERLPAPVRDLFDSTFSNGSVNERVLTLHKPSGQALPVRASTTLFGSETTSVVAVLHDLSSATQIGQKLRRLNRLASIGTLAAGVAHEIKNALVAGRTFVELLLEKHQDSELGEVVRRESGRIDAMVSQMLKFSGPARAALAPVHVHEMLDHSLRLVTPQLEAKAIVLQRSFQAEPDLVEGDDYQLQQAFVNLFLNAAEAMGAHGKLTVSTEIISGQNGSPGHGLESESHLRAVIRDTGPGISAESMARMFETFFTTKPNGTGLGLPITRRIIQQHGGRISVESQPSKGASFIILFPLMVASKTVEPALPAAATR